MIAKRLPWGAKGKRYVFLSLLMLCGLARPAAGCVSEGQYVMGTILEITVCTPASSFEAQRLLQSLFTTATRLDSLFTIFSPNSPLSRLNASAGGESKAVPPEVTAILSLSLDYWRLTHGAFDVTIGPLMAVWRRAETTQTFPSASALQQAYACVGSEKMRLSSNGNVTLTHPGMSIDLGGIGKGYALDRLATALREPGKTNALLDFGQSSIWALGTPGNAPGWRLLVRQLDGRNVGIVTLRDQALSISGSFGQSFTVQGQHYGHVIDPRSGTPLQRDLLACVIAPTAAQAEALSKALLILGEQQGIALLQRLPGVEGLLVEAEGQRWMTAGWRQAVAFIASE
jgi:thiamine biosynthesis lipoprotein